MKVKKIYSKLFFKEVILLVFLGFLVLLTYRKLPLTFFQQDEWHSLAGYYTARFGGGLSAWFSFLGVGSSWSHFNPLVGFFNLVQFTFFGLNFKLYAYASIFLHIINCFTFYILVKLLFKEKTKAFLACLLFALSSIHHQATTWIGAYGATQPVLFLALISMIFFVKYLKNLSFKTLLFSLILVLLGLGFRESVLFLFLLYPMWAYFAKGPKISKRVLGPSLIFLLIFFAPRLLFFLLRQSVAVEGTGPGFITSASSLTLFFLRMVYRLLTTPLKALAQVFFPVEWIINVSERLVTIAYPQVASPEGAALYGFTTQGIGSDLVSYALALMIIGLTLAANFYLRKNKRSQEARLLLGSLLFIFLSSLTFAFIPGKAGAFSFLDSRYLHLTSLGASVFLVLVIDIFAALLATEKRRSVTMFSLVFIFCFFHYNRIQGILSKDVETGQERRRILEKILKAYPKLGKRSVFYTESTTSFYGLPPEEKMLPFQSGPGQMLLVWYSFHNEKFPVCFFENDFLWGILSQEYKECGGRGFGYFRDYEKLLEAVRENKLKPENIYAFSYVTKDKKLENITLRIREKTEHRLIN